MKNEVYNFLYYGFGKCASSTISIALRKVEGTERSRQHKYAARAFYNKESFIKNNDLTNYFTFTFARNPYDRMVSAWKEFKRSRGFGWAKEESYFNAKNLKKSKSPQDIIDNFDCFIEFITVERHIHWHSFYEIKEINIDFIGRFENLQQDFDYVCEQTGMPKQHLSHMRASEHKHYTEYYNDETREIVAGKYAKDIEYFGYKFGE